MNTDKIFDYIKQNKKIVFVLFLLSIFLVYKAFSSSTREATEDIVNPYAKFEKGQNIADMLEAETDEDYQALYSTKIQDEMGTIKDNQIQKDKENKELKEKLKKLEEKFDYLIKNPQGGNNRNTAPFGMPVTGDNPANYNSNLFDGPSEDLQKEPIVVGTLIEWKNTGTELKSNNENEVSKISKQANKKDNKTDESKNKDSSTTKKKPKYLPSGSLFMVKYDNGTLNPTLSSGMTGNFSTATSVVVTEAYLPNGFKWDLRGAKVLFESKGNLATERADYRTKRISAISNDGKIMDIPLQGFVSDITTGMQGIAGTPVSKQEKLFWGAVKAYAIGNIGKSLQTSANDVSTNSLGTITTINRKNVSENIGLGLLAGGGQGMQEVGTNVLKIATATETVIENLAGQFAIVHLVEPLELKWEVQTTSTGSLSLNTNRNNKNTQGIKNVLQ